MGIKHEATKQLRATQTSVLIIEDLITARNSTIKTSYTLNESYYKVSRAENFNKYKYFNYNKYFP